MKMCNACGETKPYSEFHKNSEVHDGYRYTCKQCKKEKRPTNPEFTKITRKRQNKSTRKSYGTRKSAGKSPAEINRFTKYGITLEIFDAMLLSQDYKCAICKKDLAEKFCIDHCHKTGTVRGLLCYGCNNGIGTLGDDAVSLKRAYDYLIDFESQN